MLIIVEGPDCVGKTSFIKTLKACIEHDYPRDSVRVLHAGPPTSHPLDEYVVPLLAYRPGQSEHIICDRWHWGELIYPKLLNRSTQYTQGVHWYTELFLRSRGAIVVLLNAPGSILRNRLVARGDTLVQSKDVDYLIHSYLGIERLNTILATRIHSTVGNHTFHGEIQSVIAMATGFECVSTRLNNFETYVGPSHPQVLLLGEVRSIIKPLHPAFMPYPATSGHYLFDNFIPRRAGMRYGFANACDVDDVEMLWSALSHPHIIALGRNVMQRLRDGRSGIPCSSVPHPQYIRRFHNAAALDYSDVINAAASECVDLSDWKPRGASA